MKLLFLCFDVPTHDAQHGSTACSDEDEADEPPRVVPVSVCCLYNLTSVPSFGDFTPCNGEVLPSILLFVPLPRDNVGLRSVYGCAKPSKVAFPPTGKSILWQSRNDAVTDVLLENCDSLIIRRQPTVKALSDVNTTPQMPREYGAKHVKTWIQVQVG